MVEDQPNKNLVAALMVKEGSEPTDYLLRLHEDFQDSFNFPDSPVLSYCERHLSKTVQVRHSEKKKSQFEIAATKSELERCPR
jgi:hypothetical protein